MTGYVWCGGLRGRVGAIVAAVLLAGGSAVSAGGAAGRDVDGATLARVCIGLEGDVASLMEDLRGQGWEVLADPVGVARGVYAIEGQTPEALNLLSRVSTMYLLGGGNAEIMLTEARRGLEHWDKAPMAQVFGGPNTHVVYKAGVGLFSLSWRDIRGSDGSVLQVRCKFVGPSQDGDKVVRWRLPGRAMSGPFHESKRIHGQEDALGPFAGVFTEISPDGLEQLFEVRIPPLTFFDIRAHVEPDAPKDP